MTDTSTLMVDTPSDAAQRLIADLDEFLSTLALKLTANWLAPGFPIPASPDRCDHVQVYDPLPPATFIVTTLLATV